MKLYFVRHGETAFNAGGIHQHSGAELSPTGMSQAKRVAKRFNDIAIDIILASPYMRTKQTATEIHKVINKDIIYVESLREIKRPTEIEGLKSTDPEAVRIKQLIKENRANPQWHYSDEDNFHDLKKRANEFLEYVEKLPYHHVLAVTHGLILRVIICTMMLGDSFDASYFETFHDFFFAMNTGISVCEYANGKWRLLAWNDYAHL